MRLASLLLLTIALATPVHAETERLTVVELFTSQGCSSCPPANANLTKLADRPGVLALSFGVTYWDDLGWKDTFADKAYTQRQWEYARGLRHDNVFTPQVVINGRKDDVGVSLSKLDLLMKLTPGPVSGSAIRLTDASVSLNSANSPGKPAQVWLVRYDPRIVQVPVRRGENTGRTLPHRNVVRALVKLGDYTGQAVSYRLPASGDQALRTAVLVQSGPGGAIIAAARN
ncbi:MAG: hypothetical protein CFE28_03665 [Alphaproteobacteria bacterium PA2]|nr:MAG: hypothetical protein CFE28_03665 [Alphaproteobacteria bacterium PA2]